MHSSSLGDEATGSASAVLDSPAGLKKIEVCISPAIFDAVGEELDGLAAGEITITDVRSRGSRNVGKQRYRGVEYGVNLPRIKLEMLVQSACVGDVIRVLDQAAEIEGIEFAGKVLVYDLASAIALSRCESLGSQHLRRIDSYRANHGRKGGQ